MSVLRLGHRYARDKRITTHIGLVARAFGARELILDVEDTHLKESVEKINKQWGGDFRVDTTVDWKKYLMGFRGMKIHLTMYGMNINKTIDRIKSDKKDKLVVVGGKKVPSEVYGMVDYNISIGSQPHSEVSALAIFLDRLFGGKELETEFNGKLKIIPQERGKKVVKSG